MKCVRSLSGSWQVPSPLAEGRELKFSERIKLTAEMPSPLAEGRELKYQRRVAYTINRQSPLAEGRELKYVHVGQAECLDVAPRGGA